MAYRQGKVQGQWSVGYEDRVETNGRTNDRRTGAIALPPTIMRSVKRITVINGKCPLCWYDRLIVEVE